MSDADTGDMSPKRPGMNAESRGVADGESSSTHRTKTRRRRRRRRPNGSNSGIQADKIESGSTGNVETPNIDTVAAKSSHASAQPVLGENKNSKRRRRRRRRRGSRQHDAHSSMSQAADGEQRSVEAARVGSVDQPSVGDHQNDGDSGGNTTEGRKKRRNSRNRRRNRRRGQESASDHSGHLNSRPQQSGEPEQAPPVDQPRWKSEGRHKQKKHAANAYAALDLGTNNCRLLVAVPQQPGRFRVIDAFSRIVRLGEGLAATGRLSDEAMERAIGALKACADKLESKRIKRVRLIATEACRRAKNGEEFLRNAEEQAGIKLEIIDRETEARLAVAGCASLVDNRAKGVVLFDIGGGSSELALLDLDKRKRHDLSAAMVSWTSLPLGVVTLSEKHGGGKLVTREVFNDMVEDVTEMLEKFDGRDALRSVSERGEVHLLGTSGTVTTLAGIHLKLPRYNRRLVDGTWMTSRDVEAMIDALVDMSFDQRVANPCIGRDRADLVLAGCAILVAIQKLWPCPRLRVADRGLREGLLTEMMNADNAWQKRPKYFRYNRNG